MATRRQGGRQPGAWRAEAARLRRIGGYAWGPRRIARHLGVHHSSVAEYLKSLGFEPNPPEESIGWEERQISEPRLQQRIGWLSEDGPIDKLPEARVTPGSYRTRPAPSSDDA